MAERHRGQGARKPLVTVEHQTETDLATGETESRTFIKFYVEAVKTGLLREIPDGLLKTLLCIASYMNQEGVSWPSQETMARDLGIRRENVNRRIKSLLAFRFQGQPVLSMEKRRRKTDGEGDRWASNVYRVHALSGFRIFDGGKAKAPKAKEVPVAEPVCAERHTGAPEPVCAERHTGGGLCDARPTCAERHTNQNQSSLNQKHTHTEAPDGVCVSGDDSGELDRKARVLVGKFREAFGRSAKGRVGPTELAAARDVIVEEGERTSLELVRIAPAEAEKTRYSPRFFQGIVQFVPDAISSIEAKNAARERRIREKLAERSRRESYQDLPPEKRAEEVFNGQLAIAKLRKKHLSEAEKEALYERILADERAKDAPSSESGEQSRAAG